MPKKYLSKILKNGQVLYIKDAEARDSKQDKIDDLATIRSGAALGATAVQTETDPTVPAWAKQSSKPTYTASEVGLGNVGNFKAVSTVASQGLSTTEKTNARNNIGAGTSSFSGSYTDLTNKPTIPTVPTIVTSTASSALSTLVDKYYRITTAVGTMTITLPTITNSTIVSTVVIYLTAGTTPAVTISAAGNKNVYYQDGFEIEAGNTYEINALFNGDAWIVAAVKINVE